jgi:methionine synthase II (cobalamin-independent)
MNINNISGQVNINKIDIQTLSGKLDNLESVSKLSADLEYVSGVVDNNITNISTNTENINDINDVINKFNNHAFYVKSLTFSLNEGLTSVSPVPFGEAISVSISELTDNSTK